MKRKNIRVIGALILIFIGISMIIYNYYIEYNNDLIEEKSIELFFIDADNFDRKINHENEDKKDNLINYIAILEIPKIDLKRGLVNPNSSLNNVDNNIEILSPVEMPDEEHGTFILASHSGGSKVAYFDRLGELDNKDLVYVYYKNIKYTYKIVNHYEEKKDGNITIKRNKYKNVIVLTSCKKYSNDKQLVYIGNLVKQEKF